jgi:hypothetical protein
MESDKEINPAGKRMARNIARALSLIWSISWILFGLFTGMGQDLGIKRIVVLTVFPGFIYLLTTIIAWKRGLIGGLLLLIEGLIVSVYFLIKMGEVSLVGITFLFLYTIIPAISSSLLFIFSRRKPEDFRSKENSAARLGPEPNPSIK